jgi:hypothetical protein
MGEREAAEAALRLALEAVPDQPELLNSLGNCLRAGGRLFEARQAFARAVRQRPDFSEASWNLSLIQLAGGDFQRGWANYRHRHGVERESLAMPGTELPLARRGGKFFIEGEQGLGDELFFLRFAARLKARGARVIYRPDAKIASLCRRLSFLDGLAASHEAVEGGQCRLTVADLPFLLSAGDCPPPVRLVAEPARLERVRQNLTAAGPPPYLGITWRAGMVRPGSLFKQAPLADLASALAPVPATVINLQRGSEPGEAGRLQGILGRPPIDFSHFNEDLEDMLALLSLIDDYIGVSNTNMHLRAATGRAARVLVTNPAEYRWMAHGDASPWFPSFRLYRESAEGGWREAIRALGRDLIAAHGSGVAGP